MGKALCRLFVFLACLAATAPATAQEGKQAADPGIAAIEKKSAESHAKLSKMLGDMTVELKGRNLSHFMMIYNGHNIIATVRSVRASVGESVESCAANVPDIERKLSARYKNWTEKVDGRLEEAGAQVENMIIAQDYTKEEDIRTILTEADAVRAYSETIYDKVPVSTPEACAFLLEKMDETEDQLLAMLGSTLVSVPQELMKEPAPGDSVAEPAAEEEKNSMDKPAEESEPKAETP